MNVAIERRVRSGAGGSCEYYRLPEHHSKLTFVIDHIIARQHGGEDSGDNLALACGFCNRHKGPNLAGIDPDTGQLCRLFHPRKDLWQEHFEWNGALVVGLSHIGRTTIRVLAINHSYQRSVRQSLLDEGLILGKQAGALTGAVGSLQ